MKIENPAQIIGSPAQLEALRKAIQSRKRGDVQTITVCAGTGCVARGSMKVFEKIKQQLETGDLKLERTIESKGKILGTEVTFIATTRTWERPQGGMYSEGNGVLMMMKGEKVILHGSGISVAGKGAGMNLRGIRYAQTASPSFSRLNNVALVFELEIMPDGTVHDKWWEWK